MAMATYLLIGFAAFLSTLVLTPLVRWGALRVGWLHRPHPSKWMAKANPNPRSIAMGGGVGMFVGLLIVMPLLAAEIRPLPLMAFTITALLLGVWDDLRGCSPLVKLSVQTLLGVATVLAIGWVEGLPAWLAIPITIVGFVGLMNSVNMMDNMDGTASGLTVLTMLGFGALGFLTENFIVVALSFAVAGVCLGFWVYNKPPARVFMGDAGSMFLGYCLALVGTLASHGTFSNNIAQLLAPLLIVGLFITDTTFVVVWRLLHRKPIVQGDRNHLSHRLVAVLGNSEWRANILLYALQVVNGLLALGVAVLHLPSAIVCALLAFTLMITLAIRSWNVG